MVNMECPNCGKKMTKNFCMFCGYISNGNYITNNDSKISDIEKAFGDEYNVIVKNDNKLFVFLLGPLYFSYRNYFFLGLTLEILNIISYFILYNIFYNLTNIGPFTFAPILILFYFLLNKFFWVIISNPIYILLMNKKINRIKKQCKMNKDEYIANIKIRNIYKLICVVISICLIPIIVFIVVRWFFGNL